MAKNTPETGSEQGLTDILASIKDVPVLVAGDVMQDRFIYGKVERISPESPVPVLTIMREDSMLGGAGNTLANLAGLGADSRLLSVIGQDTAGQAVTESLKALGLTAEGLVSDQSRPTTVKTRYLAGHQQLLRSDFEKSGAVSDDIAAEILKRAEKLIKGAKALILSDYGKGMLRADVIAGLIALAGKAGIPVIVDPKGTDFKKYKGAFAVTPNRKELELASAMSAGSDAEVIAAAEKIIKECGIEAVIATRSKDGMSVIQKSADALHLRSADIEVFDVSGAGDAVIATLSAALAAGAPLAGAAALANLAGGIVVTKVGTAPIRASELLQAIEQGGRRAALMGWEEAAEQIRRWHARGLKIGFTNGCFDILHAGHVAYLEEARGHCDRLIVGLNNDASVRILKGADRPVHDESSRAAVLGALSCVDMVVAFGAQKPGEDNTAIKLLELLKPDVYFKGGDYKISEIPEAPAVQAHGGTVMVMGLQDGHSTTGSIAKIRTNAA